ncbi:uncharacterized protein [Miscanthus floridulus]|uniref:uncharacterized protein n=1 Tax=Miscanthus floridulus TaxID=154761 RepID=UPI003459A42E
MLLADSTRTWLERLLPNRIYGWADLKEIFVGNFQGTYARPGNPWDLKNCQQKYEETLREYIRRFSWTTCESLVDKLGHKGPRTTKELLDIATSHASGKEAVGAIFNHSKGKAKRDNDAGESASNRPHKKKNKQRHESSLMAATDCKGGQRPAKGAPDHFEKLLEGPCSNHAFHVKHLYKDCALMKQFLSDGANKGEPRRDPKPTVDDADRKDDGLSTLDGCLMIFEGSTAYDSKRQQMLARREVYTTEPATPAFLRWSESAITFDRTDHPDSIPQPGRYPLVVDPIVGTKRLTKVLVDGDSGLNILYAKTLDAMGIDQAHVRPTGVPFYGIVPGEQAMPLGQIDLPVTFGSPTNYRTETLTFEVVGFHGTYHAILGRPCYAKFMAVPKYTYLKLKMPDPRGVITVGTSFQRAYECKVECCEHAAAIVASTKHAAI